MTIEQAPIAAPATAEDPFWRPSTAAIAAIAFAGIVTIALASWWESHALQQEPWKDGLVILDTNPLWDDSISIQRFTLPDNNFPPDSRIVQELEAVEGGSELVELAGLKMRESLVYADAPPAFFEPVLASGRLPVAGQAEVLAGVLCRLESFTIGDREFAVVGRLKGGASGLLFSYVLSKADVFDSIADAQPDSRTGWLAPEGQTKHPNWQDELEPLIASEEASVVLPMVLTHRGAAGLAVAGLLTMLVASILLQVRGLRALALHVKPLRWFTDLFESERYLFVGLHVCTYAALIVPMAFALMTPLTHLQVLQYVTSVFTEGELKQLGEAYMSRNILLAAWETWRNNFLIQTLLLVIVPGIVPGLGTLFGAGKMLLSLAFAGFALCPNWAGFMEGYTYHSVTMALEVEAYTWAIFLISALCMKTLRALFKQDGSLVLPGLRGYVMGTVIVAVWLGAGALYEAVTLILLPR